MTKEELTLQCPTCGKFVSENDGYYMFDEYEHFTEPYCDEKCANKEILKRKQANGTD